MFQFPASAAGIYAFNAGFQGIALERFRIRGSPGELARSKPGLIAAVPRPSSPLNARASTMHPFLLDHTFHLTRSILGARPASSKTTRADRIGVLDSIRVPLGFQRTMWWRRQDSNPRPLACKASALPTELRPRLRDSHAEGSKNRSRAWCTRVDSNHLPRAYQARALTS